MFTGQFIDSRLRRRWRIITGFCNKTSYGRSDSAVFGRCRNGVCRPGSGAGQSQPGAREQLKSLNSDCCMLEARLHRSSEDAPAQPPEIVTQPTPAAPIIPPVSVPPPLPVYRRSAANTRDETDHRRLKRYRWRPPRRPSRTIDWEQFMGAKMFAWIGGFALFLGVAFFVKYSFEHNLISPELRVAIGFLAGIALVIGGVALKRKENVVTAQTLCATGILILYAVTFACRSFYHFPFFGLIPTFALMSLITAAAFLLAVRMDALVVAILGIAGGFLTPVLLSTGQDNPSGTVRLHRAARYRFAGRCAAQRMELASDPGCYRHSAHANRMGRQFLSARTVLRRKQNIDSDGGVSRLRNSVPGGCAHNQARGKIGHCDLRRCPRRGRVRDATGHFTFSPSPPSEAGRS